MSFMSTHPLGTTRWDGQLCIIGSIITEVQGMSFMSTCPLRTEGWKGQLEDKTRSRLKGLKGQLGD